MDAYRTLDAWQLAHEIVIRTMRKLDEINQPRSWELFHQLRKAVISVEANIVEGYALETPGYFCKHMRIAFGSAAEAECLFNDAAELKYLPNAFVSPIIELLGRCLQTLRGLIRRGHP